MRSSVLSSFMTFNYKHIYTKIFFTLSSDNLFQDLKNVKKKCSFYLLFLQGSVLGS